jgi:hypothetical protein
LVGQSQIEENYIRRSSAHSLDSAGSCSDRSDVVMRSGERLAHLFWQERKVIVDEQNVRHAVVRMVRENAVPSIPVDEPVLGTRAARARPWRRPLKPRAPPA